MPSSKVEFFPLKKAPAGAFGSILAKQPQEQIDGQENEESKEG
jgi:hypothetical protein